MKEPAVASETPETIVTVTDCVGPGGSPTQVVQICSNRWRENCFLLVDPKSRSCIAVDPGYGDEAITQEIRSRSLTIQAILATHTHFDHIASVATLQRDWGGAPFLCHQDEPKILKDANTFTLFLKAGKIEMPKPERLLQDGETIDFGTSSGAGVVKVHHMPGHTPGGCVFEYGKVLFTGDLLIKSQGQLHKLPGFDRKALEASWAKLFATFGDDHVVFPGHGAVTTLGKERQRMVVQ